MKALWLSLALFCTIAKTNAQTDKRFGSWNTLNAVYNIDKNWSVWGELQLRSMHFFDWHYYYETKGGVQYNIGKAASVLAGFGRYITDQPTGNFKTPIVNNELRSWLQFSVQNNLDRLKIDHRYRIEQRWINHQYSNRFRYRISAIVPINHAKVQDNTFYVSASDEIFMTDKAPHFLRNRLFVGGGYMINKGITIQTGILRQYDYKASTSQGASKDFLQTTLLLNIKQLLSGREPHPSAHD